MHSYTTIIPVQNNILSFQQQDFDDLKCLALLQPQFEELIEKVFMLLVEKNGSTVKLRQLTCCEQKVLEQLSAGRLYKEIALDLNITIDTVKKHCSNMYKKLEVNNKTEAINLFLGRLF
jgi:DNA-binding NarL/FixJ family response regulator